jgi:Na+/H+ antiporter NhaC
MVPVTPELAPQLDSENESLRESPGFFDQLREGSRAPRILGHWTSLAPPMLALLVALYFRSIVFALLSAFVAGAFLSFGLNPLVVLTLAFYDFIWESLSSFFSLYIFLFLFTLVGLVHLISRNGGLSGLVALVGKLATSRRRAQLSVGVSGLAIFFDDYSNTVILGNTMRRLSDKWRISREKLAYLIDSTTAPVAGLAVLSTWIAAESMLLGSEAKNLGIELPGYSIFIELLPMRFYCLGTLIFLFINAAMGREFGPMYRAETRASVEGKLLPDESQPLGIQSTSSTEPTEDVPRRAVNAIVPLAIVIFGIVIGILALGKYRIEISGESFSWADFGDWRAAFGEAVGDTDSAGAMPILLLASLLGGLAAFGLTIGQRLLSVKESVQTYVSGMPTMWMAIFILLMTWSMQDICENLGTAQYLIDFLGDGMPIWWLPLFTFVVASLMSFATGTSWGAIGILIPIILPLAHGMGTFDDNGGLIFFLTAAAILDGAIFGDHCSPISDTTVLTSISSGCDHIAHVKTQLPYAALTMTLSGLFGYLAVAQKFPIWIFYLLFPISVFAIFKTFGRPIPDANIEQGVD